MRHMGKKLFFSSYAEDCVNLYTSKSLVKWFVENLGNRLHVNFLGFSHWFIPISISYMRDHSILVHQDRYAISIVAKYLDTITVKASKKILRPLCNII